MIKYTYNDYEKYLVNQKEKTSGVLLFAEKLNKKIGKKFYRRNEHLKKIKESGKVLCVGARTGAEVEAFIELGYDAIGIDLLECKPYVIVMDMMNMKFDCKFDIIYTNSIDHCYDIVKFAEQIKNNINSNGILIIDINHGVRAGKIGKYESVSIGKNEDIVDIFCKNGFKFINKFINLPKRYNRRMIEEQFMFSL